MSLVTDDLPIVHSTPTALAPTTPDRDVGRLVERWLTRRSAATRRAYTRDLAHFAVWLGVATPVDAVRHLLAAGHAGANQLADDYVGSLTQAGLSSATVNRRLSSIRSIVSLAQLRGLIEWSIEVEGEKVQAYRDTRGPGLRAVQAMLHAAAAQGGLKGLRDVTLLLVLFSWGLRRQEVSSLDVEHFDRAERRLSIMAKGKTQREWIDLPAPVADKLSRYLDARGAKAGEPLFVNFDRAHKGSRLTTSGLYRMVRRLGERAGVPRIVSPHRLRHTAITTGLDGTGGDVRKVRVFSRHARLETVGLYDDNRRDLGGEVANLLAAALGDVNVDLDDHDVEPAEHTGDLPKKPEARPADEHGNIHYQALPEGPER